MTHKILIINTLLMSTLTYKMQILDEFNEEDVIKLEDKILRFLWHGKRPKVSFDILKCAKKDGGMKEKYFCHVTREMATSKII